jgi:hypothetical protein
MKIAVEAKLKRKDHITAMLRLAKISAQISRKS